MTDAVLRIRRDVGWSPDLTAEYVGVEAPSAAACNSALIEVMAVADRVIGGSVLLNDDRTAWITPMAPGADNPQPEVGRYLSVADLRPATPSQHAQLLSLGFSEEAIAFIAYRQDVTLALAQVGRELGQSSAGELRDAGWVQIAAIAGVAALVGLAVDWYCANRSRADESTRIRQAGIVQAGRDAAERLRVAAETGRPATAPTPVELAAAASISAAASQAREAGIGQQVGQAVADTVSGLGKVAALAAVVLVGSEVMKSSRDRS